MSLVVIVSQGWMCLWKVTLQVGWRNAVGGGFLRSSEVDSNLRTLIRIHVTAAMFLCGSYSLWKDLAREKP